MQPDTSNRTIKLIALDMDGTLLRDDQTISEENRKVIEEVRKTGIEVMLCTGRHLTSCQEQAKSLQLSSYLVTVNGSEIWDGNGQLIERKTIPTESMEKIMEISDRHGGESWIASIHEVWRGEMPENLADHEWLKYGIDTYDPKVKEGIIAELIDDPNLELSNSSPTNIEINYKGVNKAEALERVCELSGITMDEVMVVGDSLNDIKMIKRAGLGVAMGNAQPEVKEVADWETGTNMENGVAQAIRYFVLDKQKHRNV